MSNPNTSFKKVTVESYGGISPDSPLTIVFPENFSGGTVFEGNQGTNKTSTMMALESLLGGLYPDYYINKESKTINGAMEFTVDDVNYRSKITKTQFKLEQFINVAGKDKWISTGEDKKLIRQLLPFATSPEILTTKNGEEQIEWLKKLAGSTADDNQLALEYKKKYDERTVKNREVDIYKKQLLESERFVKEGKDIKPSEDYEKFQSEMLGIDIDKVIAIQEAEQQNLNVEYERYQKAKTKLETIDATIIEKNKSIEDKRKQILDLEASISAIAEEIKKQEDLKVAGQQFISENVSIVERMAKISELIKESRLSKQTQESCVSTNKTYDTYKVVFDEANLLTNKLDEISEQRLALAKTFTPDIEGFEVELGNLDKEKGIYLNGINIATLSESERYGLCLKIWAFYKIRVVFIENITSLGSSAMEIINMFIEQGGTVFATKMNRNQDKISVSFNIND